MKFTYFLALLPVVASLDVKVCFEGVHASPIQDAKVQCYDSTTETELGAPAYTDANGCAAVAVGKSSPVSGVHCSLEENGQCYATTTSKIFLLTEESNRPIDLGVIQVESDIHYCSAQFLELSSSGSGVQQLRATRRELANGCGPGFIPSWLRKVLDTVSGFRAECNIHDRCYGFCWQTRSRCDSQFETNMRNRCAGVNFLLRSPCYTLADIFYRAVSSSGGKKACEGARRGRCSRTAVALCA